MELERKSGVGVDLDGVETSALVGLRGWVVNWEVFSPKQRMVFATALLMFSTYGAAVGLINTAGIGRDSAVIGLQEEGCYGEAARLVVVDLEDESEVAGVGRFPVCGLTSLGGIANRDYAVAAQKIEPGDWSLNALMDYQGARLLAVGVVD